MGKLTAGEAVQARLELVLHDQAISKAELARRVGLPKRTVENYFKGHAPSAEALFLLSKGLGVPVDWLLGDLSNKSERQIGSDRDFLLKSCIAAAAKEILGDYLSKDKAGVVEKLADQIANNATQKIYFVQKVEPGL